VCSTDQYERHSEEPGRKFEGIRGWQRFFEIRLLVSEEAELSIKGLILRKNFGKE
jgi:hypothetical protein